MKLKLNTDKYTKNFWKKEFRCTHCYKGKMNRKFMQMLQVARNITGIPFRINSGWRCPEWNAEVGGTPLSSHLHGIACDISCMNSTARQTIIFALLAAGFTRIGIGKTFIHVDQADQSGPIKKPSAIWLY